MTRRELVRAMLALATFAVVWLVACPASAMAPLCDPRGAIGFAPPPQIQDAELSLDIPALCTEESPLATKNYAPGRRPPSLELAPTDPVAEGAPVVVPRPPMMRTHVAHAVEARPPPGVKASLERPPRP